MLAVALDIAIDSGRITELGWQRENLLEILVGLFARKLVDAVRLGLPRRYGALARYRT
jgi:5-methylcytosine-specific restriction enzyme subunit McrC